MKRTLRKTLAIILAALMLICSVPLAGLADIDLPDIGSFFAKAETATSGKCGANLTWTLDLLTGALSISGTGEMFSYYYDPSSVPWYSSRSLIKSVTIGNGVTSIGSYAFRFCDNLASVTIGNSVTRIGYEAFQYCYSLANITVDPANTAYLNDEYGVLFNKNKTQLIQYPVGNTRTSYEIPDSVTSIGDYAFQHCDSLASVTIPDSVTSIGYDAFYSCDSLASVTIPDSVTSIGYGAFEYCDSLASVTIGNSVTSIGGSAFRYCYSLASVTIPDSVTSIGDYAFEDCTSLASITIPDSVTSIGDCAFQNCDSLTSITIPDSVTSIGNYAFFGCDSLASITIPDSVTRIYVEAFRMCYNLKDVYYSGSEEEWNAITISIGSYGDPLLNTTIHFNYKSCTHSYTSTITTPATCMENGVMTYTCRECGDVYTEAIPATGHNASEWEVVTNSSCTAVGEKAKKCTECGEILETEEITMIEHIAGEWEITANADCTENGEKVKRCVNCDTVIETAEISATGHNQGSWVISIEPTCIEEGEMVAHCTECGVIVANEMISAKGHKAGAWETVLEPTTEAEGKKVKKCTVCDVILEEAAIAKPPKEPVKDSAIVKNPSTSKISYGDAIILHVDESKIPAGGRVEWTASNGNFSYKADGATCTISPAKSGDTTFTATIYDADGNAVSTDVQTMTSKAGFFDKIIAFFKKLFGLTKTYPDVFGI